MKKLRRRSKYREFECVSGALNICSRMLTLLPHAFDVAELSKKAIERNEAVNAAKPHAYAQHAKACQQDAPTMLLRVRNTGMS